MTTLQRERVVPIKLWKAVNVIAGNNPRLARAFVMHAVTQEGLTFLRDASHSIPRDEEWRVINTLVAVRAACMAEVNDIERTAGAEKRRWQPDDADDIPF